MVWCKWLRIFVCNDWFYCLCRFYSLWTKRTSIHQTVIGSISGASPPVIGYTAVTHQFDVAALLLFLAYALWQMPHSWAIAIYRFDDYKMREFLSCL